MSIVALAVPGGQTGLAVEEQLARPARAEVEHVGDRPGELVERAIADPPELPVVFDEPDHGGLIGERVVDGVGPAPRRDHDEWHPRPVAAATLVAREARRMRAALPGPRE